MTAPGIQVWWNSHFGEVEGLSMYFSIIHPNICVLAGTRLLKTVVHRDATLHGKNVFQTKKQKWLDWGLVGLDEEPSHKQQYETNI